MVHNIYKIALVYQGILPSPLIFSSSMNPRAGLVFTLFAAETVSSTTFGSEAFLLEVLLGFASRTVGIFGFVSIVSLLCSLWISQGRPHLLSGVQKALHVLSGGAFSRITPFLHMFLVNQPNHPFLIISSIMSRSW